MKVRPNFLQGSVYWNIKTRKSLLAEIVSPPTVGGRLWEEVNVVQWQAAVTNPAITKTPLQRRPRYNELILTVSTHNLPRNNEYFVLSLAVSKSDMMIQMVDRPNTTLLGQDREALTFKALLYLNVTIHVQVCRPFCVVYIPVFSLV